MRARDIAAQQKIPGKPIVIPRLRSLLDAACTVPAGFVVGALIRRVSRVSWLLILILASDVSADVQPHQRLKEAVEAFLQGDYDNSVELLVPLAEEGDPDAAYLLSSQLELAVADNRKHRGDRGRIEHREHRLSLLEAAAENGHLGSLRYLYRRFGAPISEDARITWIEYAIELGDSRALVERAGRSLNMKGVIDRDLFEQAHTTGHLWSTLILGLYYRDPQFTPDPRRAFQLALAAAVPMGGGVEWLANDYKDGSGTARDPVKALQWYYVARDRDSKANSPYKEQILELEEELTAPQRRESRNAADSFLAERRSILEDEGSLRGKTFGWLKTHYPKRARRMELLWMFAPTLFDPAWLCPPPEIEQIEIEGWFESAPSQKRLKEQAEHGNW